MLMAGHPSQGRKGLASNALIHLRVPAGTKARWVRESRAEGKRLTDWIIEKIDGKESTVENALTQLFDTIIEEHPKLTEKAHRGHLAAIARGIRLMRRYGANGGYDVPKPGPGFDEWVAANDYFAAACNKVREAVGEEERTITRRIRDLEAQSPA